MTTVPLSSPDATGHRRMEALRRASLVDMADRMPRAYLTPELLDAGRRLAQKAAQDAWFAVVCDELARP